MRRNYFAPMREALLIADIGGTSSRWAFIDENGSTTTWPDALPGFNPTNGDAARFTQAVREHFEAKAPAVLACGSIAVYGAGCGHELRRERMRSVMAGIFPKASIDVQSDLLGAAHALYGSEAGLVLILGTGMNAGWYDGATLHLPMPSLGYLLGDEGSGADLGRHLLNALYYDRLPPGTVGLLFPEGRPELATTIEHVHRSASPAQALASYAKLLATHQNDPAVNALVTARFNALAEVLAHFFPKEQRVEVRGIGSIASGFADVLRTALASLGMRLTAVEQDPMQGLLRYRSARAH